MESKQRTDNQSQAPALSQHQQCQSFESWQDVNCHNFCHNSCHHQNAQDEASGLPGNDQQDAMSVHSCSSWESHETLVPTPTEQSCRHKPQLQQVQHQLRRQPQDQPQHPTPQLSPRPRNERGCKHLKALRPPPPVIAEKEHKDRSLLGKVFHSIGNFYKWNEWAWKRRKGLI